MAKGKESNGSGKDSGLFGTAWQNVRMVWREIVRVSTRSGGETDAAPEALREQIEECLRQRGGEVSARNRAASLARAYIEFGPEARLRFLRLLNEEFGANANAIAVAIEKLNAATELRDIESARHRLREALEPARVALLRKFTTLHSGPRFLVELRRELLDLLKENPDLAPLERDLKELLRSWFDVGFLELRSITWNSPASLLEKLSRYEAVHRVRGWVDLKNRLDIDRRCFAFFHPCMPDEPLIFIEVALTRDLATQIQELLDPKAEALESDEADTAIFYSISNAQRGLDGISFGNFLIKQVVDQLRRGLPNLKRFSTLSPIPGYVKWLREELAGNRVSLTASEAKKLKPLAGELAPLEFLAKSLESPAWARDSAIADALKAPLMRLCARYLLQAKRSDGLGALNPVAHFHLNNGARVEQLNWLGDTSAKGMQESAGIMINYLYRLDRIDRCHEEYRSKGKIAASSSVEGLAG